MIQTIQTFLLSAGGFAVVLGVLIFVHEGGHFLMAKLIGVRVETFSLGFGPRLWGFRRGHTDYRLSAVPLGGYVKMLGENPDEELRGSPEEFQSRARWERFLVLVMGPGVNLLFAYLVYTGLFLVGVPEATFMTSPTIVGEVADGSPASRAGIRPGDRILAADGEVLPTYEDFLLFEVMNPGRKTDLSIVRDGEALSVPVEIGVEKKHRSGQLGIAPAVLTQVHDVLPSSPAQKAGLEPGDLILSLEGQRRDFEDLAVSLPGIVKAHAGHPLPMVVLRGGKEVALTLVPDPGTGQAGFHFGPPMRVERYGIVGAMAHAGTRFGGEAVLLFKVLRKLTGGQLSLRALSGPLEIAKISGSRASLGLVPFLSFMGLVSLQLGIINLLPIPILDGGGILILGLEGVARREFPPAVKERLMMAGAIFLMALMVVVVYFDFIKLFVPEG